MGQRLASDFRIDEVGHQRFVLFVDPLTDERRVGRIIQRLCEIEMYNPCQCWALLECVVWQGKWVILIQNYPI